ncbi:MAG: ribosome silencing factor [Coriobacteriales bacterium]
MAQEDTRQYALVAARAIDEKKGTDIVIQDVSDLLKVTDYFVIATGANNRRVDAIAEEVEDKLREECGIKPISREGKDELEWVLLDYGCIVVHVFQPASRDFYRLEQLWEEAPTVDVAAAGIEDPVYSERIKNLLERR